MSCWPYGPLDDYGSGKKAASGPQVSNSFRESRKDSEDTEVA